jgi:hypothetical protein
VVKMIESKVWVTRYKAAASHQWTTKQNSGTKGQRWWSHNKREFKKEIYDVEIDTKKRKQWLMDWFLKNSADWATQHPSYSKSGHKIWLFMPADKVHWFANCGEQCC